MQKVRVAVHRVIQRLAEPFLAVQVRTAWGAYWVPGAVIAGFTAVIAETRLGRTAGLPYAVVAAMLLVLALVTSRGQRWGVALSLVLLGGQIIDLAGAVI